MKPAEADLPSTNGPERAHPAEDGEEAMPLPADSKVISLGGMFFILLLAALYALYAAAEIVWPLVFAFMLSLLLNPSCAFWPSCAFRAYSAPCC